MCWFFREAPFGACLVRASTICCPEATCLDREVCPKKSMLSDPQEVPPGLSGTTPLPPAEAISGIMAARNSRCEVKAELNAEVSFTMP